jgi:putative transcriptional regulator
VEPTTGSLRGRLLVATPPLVDPNFDRSVVLMLEHGDDGALGVVLNRPSDTTLDDVLPEWYALAAAPAVVFSGGPVAPDAVIALARVNARTQVPEDSGLVPVVAGLGTVDLGRDPDDLAGTLDRLRVFVGYAGWAPGQLESELDREAWFVVELMPDDPFATTPASMWHDVLRRQRGPMAMFAHFPDDPADN